MIRAIRPAGRLELVGTSQGHRVQELAIQQTRALADVPLATAGSRVSATFTAGQTITLTHKLGRIPVAWALLDVTGGYGAFQRAAWDAGTLTVQSQNACTATWWVA